MLLLLLLLLCGECCLSRLSLATCPSTGAGNKIIRCEVSLDDGKSWRLAEVTHRTPPNEYGKHWAWVWWSLDVPIGEPAASCFLPDVQREGRSRGWLLSCRLPALSRLVC